MPYDARQMLMEVVSRDTPASEPAPWARRAAALLSTITDDDRRADLRFVFEERAGICEFSGNLSRDEAERIAFEQLDTAVRGEP